MAMGTAVLNGIANKRICQLTTLNEREHICRVSRYCSYNFRRTRINNTTYAGEMFIVEIGTDLL